MADLRNIELKTKSKVVSSKTSGTNLGGQVPSGMKRWVTFLSVDGILLTAAKSIKLYLASVGVSNPTRASMVATANRKWMIDLRATGIKGVRDQTPEGPPLMIPDQPNTEKPLFSIASGKWLGAYVSNTTGLVLVQYFDE